MQFPRYWAKASQETVDSDGQKFLATCWGWSNSSESEAQASAEQSVARLAERLSQGEVRGAYGYGERPFREPVLESEVDANGELAVAITRNSYGCEVLNAARVMFVDVDFPPVAAGAQISHFFSRLFGGKRPSPERSQELEAIEKLKEFLKANPTWGLRLYRTKAGMRILATHDLFDPTSNNTRFYLEQFGADPLYVQLCHNQRCFRARLTPKPWRCEHAPNRIVWPHQSEEDRSRFERWLDEYRKRQAGYATCRYLESLGAEATHPEIDRVVRKHDEATRCREDLPLA